MTARDIINGLLDCGVAAKDLVIKHWMESAVWCSDNEKWTFICVEK